MDEWLIFAMGAMVGQIVLVAGMNLWAWLEDGEEEVPVEREAPWHFDQEKNVWRQR